MVTRCKVCGSKNITREIKKEGYDIKKGVIGTALIGVPGALAGAVGKDTIYYHCADCGHVLNQPMASYESDRIDRAIYYSKDKIELRALKQLYKNIEWEESANTIVSDVSSTILSTEQVLSLNKNIFLSSDEVKKDVLEQLSNQKNLMEKEVLMLRYADTKYSIVERAIDDLLDNGRVVCETVAKTEYYRLVTDINEIKENHKRMVAIKLSKKLLDKKYNVGYEQYEKDFFDLLKEKKNYKENELQQFLDEHLKERIFSNVRMNVDLQEIDMELFWNEFKRNFIQKLCGDEKILVKAGIYHLRSEDEIKEVLTGKKKDELELIRNKCKKEIDIIYNFLQKNNYRRFSEKQILNEAAVEKWGNGKKALYYLSESGHIEKTLKGKAEYYAVFGWEQNAENRQLIKEQEKEAIERKNAEIRAKIEMLEQEKNLVNTTISENKNKLFGAGVKARKEAQVRLEEINTEILKLRSQIQLVKKKFS